MQQDTWLGDMCDEVRRVVLIEGDTMIIPAGYIHAVVCDLAGYQNQTDVQYTPMNSIVFGGNFVHSYDIPAQLRLRQIEIDTKVPQRFRFPLFDK
jgi:F-box/leucine-rich repeat protein 10/11